MPVPAVRTGGSRGSARDRKSPCWAADEGLSTIVLRPVWGSWINVPRPASLPVPAVVGMATMGGRSDVIRSRPPACKS